MDHALRTLIVIPAWNEEGSIADVIREIRQVRPGQDIVVVNDGSTDRTARAAAEAGVAVLTMPFNAGVGGAMRTGFAYAVRNGYTCVIQVDADGQHDPRHIEELVERVRQGDEVVIGARFAGVGDYRVRGPRWWAMRVLASAMSRLCGVQLTDVTSGFRASSGRALALFARDFPEEYLGDTLESLVMAARADLKVSQVPVAMRARAAGEPSQSPVKAAVYLSRAGLVLLLALIRKRPVVPALEAAR